MAIFKEVILEDHEAISKSLEMVTVMHLFGKDVARVDNTRDMGYFGCIVLMVFTDLIFIKIEMLDNFGNGISRPVVTGLVVVIDNCES